MSEFKLLYFGLPLGALALLRDGRDLATACISRTDAPGMRRLRRAMSERGRLLLGKPDLENAGVQELLFSTKPQLVVSWFWTKRIPWDVIRQAPHAFGVHPSLLPRHRGADPYFWTLASCDREAGVTAHQLTTRYDDGAILAQQKVKIPPGCNAWQLARALDTPSLQLLRDVVGRYARGEVPTAIPQDDERMSEAPPPADEDCEILWEWSVEEVIARVRAAAPEPGAFTGYGEDTVVILGAQRAANVPVQLEPGEIALTDDGVVIRAGDGGIVVTRARREGEDAVARGGDVVQLFPGIPKL